MNRVELFQIVICIVFCCPAIKAQTIDPTGTYNLHEGIVDMESDDQERFGTVKVTLVDSNWIELSLFYDTGYGQGRRPHHVAHIDDRLYYNHNNASIWFADERFSDTCTVTFIFDEAGVEVRQRQVSLDCGLFGVAVYVDGYYKKISDEIIACEPRTTYDEEEDCVND